MEEDEQPVKIHRCQQRKDGDKRQHTAGGSPDDSPEEPLFPGIEPTDQRQEDAAQRKTTAQAEQCPHVRHMRLLTLVESVVCYAVHGKYELEVALALEVIGNQLGGGTVLLRRKAGCFRRSGAQHERLHQGRLRTDPVNDGCQHGQAKQKRRQDGNELIAHRKISFPGKAI